ncbi:DUF2202 domain-containing protein [Lysinimonas soli]|uniref:DUF2202 domain-containing protein n=1 Tax=Lysinimonas soli TaxID=1074233 RepID=A0ABW0NS06_9MICO
MKTRGLVITVVAAGLVVAGAGVTAIVLSNPGSEASRSQATASSAPEPSSDVTTRDTGASLLYMIEEEKLAHDVYLALAQTWGANIFRNISRSETTHQDLLVPLLESRTIVDPRAAEAGAFTDPELQTLYTELVAQGRSSYDEAIQVGLIIEKKDIADLGHALDREDEADVIAAYQRLLAGSQNHLTAFERLA